MIASTSPSNKPALSKSPHRRSAAEVKRILRGIRQALFGSTNQRAVNTLELPDCDFQERLLDEARSACLDGLGIPEIVRRVEQAALAENVRLVQVEAAVRRWLGYES